MARILPNQLNNVVDNGLRPQRRRRRRRLGRLHSCVLLRPMRACRRRRRRAAAMCLCMCLNAIVNNNTLSRRNMMMDGERAHERVSAISMPRTRARHGDERSSASTMALALAICVVVLYYKRKKIKCRSIKSQNGAARPELYNTRAGPVDY